MERSMREMISKYIVPSAASKEEIKEEVKEEVK